MGMLTLEQAIKRNPYNAEQGNISAYCRYLRYSVKGFYNKTNDEVKEVLQTFISKELLN